jgi:hypothetical protein
VKHRGTPSPDEQYDFRQMLFGGPLREPSFTASWKRTYERHLQKDTRKVQQIAERYLAAA